MPERARHPCAGMTRAQRQTFERIAIGDDGAVNQRTADVLIRRGVIEMYQEYHGGQVPFTIVRYRVPLPVHMQWCQWCADAD